MNRVRSILLFIVITLCFINTPFSHANATYTNGTLGENTWLITDGKLELKNDNLNLSVIYQNSTCTYYGDIFSSRTWLDSDIFLDENEPLWQYIMENPTYCLEIDLKELSVPISTDYSLQDLREVIVTDKVEFIENYSLTGCYNLIDVTILSKDVNILNSGIGFASTENKLENMIIKGYKNSTAETYANENGFTFIALDEPTTTTETETTTTTITQQATESTEAVSEEITTSTDITSTTTQHETTTITKITETTTQSENTDITETNNTSEITNNTTTTTTTTTTTPTTETDLPQTGMPYTKELEAFAVTFTLGGTALILKSRKKK